jgi:hypothetical protein
MAEAAVVVYEDEATTACILLRRYRRSVTNMHRGGPDETREDIQRVGRGLGG